MKRILLVIGLGIPLILAYLAFDVIVCGRPLDIERAIYCYIFAAACTAILMIALGIHKEEKQ